MTIVSILCYLVLVGVGLIIIHQLSGYNDYHSPPKIKTMAGLMLAPLVVVPAIDYFTGIGIHMTTLFILLLIIGLVLCIYGLVCLKGKYHYFEIVILTGVLVSALSIIALSIADRPHGKVLETVISKQCQNPSE